MRPFFSAVLVVLLGCGGSATPAVDERSQLVDPEVPTVRARLSRPAFRIR